MVGRAVELLWRQFSFISPLQYHATECYLEHQWVLSRRRAAVFAGEVELFLSVGRWRPLYPLCCCHISLLFMRQNFPKCSPLSLPWLQILHFSLELELPAVRPGRKIAVVRSGCICQLAQGRRQAALSWLVTVFVAAEEGVKDGQSHKGVSLSLLRAADSYNSSMWLTSLFSPTK